MISTLPGVLVAFLPVVLQSHETPLVGMNLNCLYAGTENWNRASSAGGR